MLDKTRLAHDIRRIALLKGEFVLRSGLVSDQYFDKYLFESDPRLLRSIAEQMVQLIPQETEILAGLEMGGIPVVTALSQITGLPAAFIRKGAKSYGTCKYAEGPDLAGRKIVLIEDVVSSGGAILDALQKLRSDHIHPLAAVCVIDRQTGGAENLAGLGLELRSVFTMEEIQNTSPTQ